MSTINQKQADTSNMSLPRRMWEGWKRIARKIGDFNARVILTIFYFVLMMPFAILVKLFTDPLEIKKKTMKKGWQPKEEKPGVSPMERAAKQS